MRLPNLARWLRTRNAAIASRRVANAARTKGEVFVETRTVDCGWPGCAQLPAACRWPDCRYGSKPDVLTALAAHVDVDPQPTYREEQIGRGMTA